MTPNTAPSQITALTSVLAAPAAPKPAGLLMPVPGRVGLVSGLMSGLMFGIGGIGAAGLGGLADLKGIVWVDGVTAFLPLLGLATAFLPDTHRRG